MAPQRPITLELIAAQLIQMEKPLQADDIVIIAQKIVSKAEGRLRQFAAIQPGDEAFQLAETTDKDPRVVQAILDDSNEVLRAKPGLLITIQPDTG